MLLSFSFGASIATTTAAPLIHSLHLHCSFLYLHPLPCTSPFRTLINKWLVYFGHPPKDRLLARKLKKKEKAWSEYPFDGFFKREEGSWNGRPIYFSPRDSERADDRQKEEEEEEDTERREELTSWRSSRKSQGREQSELVLRPRRTSQCGSRHNTSGRSN